jgi:transmembrane protein 33
MNGWNSYPNALSTVISLVWLFSRQVPLALLPFTVYSVFHVATYTRTNIIPALQPPKAAPGATPTSPSAQKSQSPLATSIGRFVKEYYDASMFLVATLEIALWLRLFFSALTFSKGSWVLLTIYTIFLRARFSQSQFIQGAFADLSARIDQRVQNPNVPPAVRQGWDTYKGLMRQVVDATNVSKYLGAQQTPQKKQS